MDKMDEIDEMDDMDGKVVPSSITAFSILPAHGGYRKLLTFQLAQLIYDVTVRFCARYVRVTSRTTDQMTQAARSGVQNIAEGSIAAATSRKTEIRLTQVARASLEELLLDYEDFLRQRALPLWQETDEKRRAFVDRRCTTIEDVLQWIVVHAPTPKAYPEYSANVVHTLIGVTCALLDRQVARLAHDLTQSAGFGERIVKGKKSR